MPTDKEHKLAAYWLLTGKLPPDVDASKVRKPEIKQAVADMRQTISALKNWRDAHEKLPQLALKPAARRIHLWQWVAAGAAAAAVVAACLIGWNWWNATKTGTQQLAQTDKPTQTSSPTQTAELAKAFAWTEQIEESPNSPMSTTKPADMVSTPFSGPGSTGTSGKGNSGDTGSTVAPGAGGAPGKPRANSGSTGEIYQGKPGSTGNTPASGGIPPGAVVGGSKGGGGGPNVAPGAGTNVPHSGNKEESLQDQPARDKFVAKFSFAFQIPPQLPGGWAISHGRAVSNNQAQLFYIKGQARMSVFLTPSAGPDLPLQPASVGSHDTIIMRLAARKSGLAVAFQGETAANDLSDKVIDLYLSK